ncbi:MAG: VTT domain-containing protein [Acidobacteriota bacterium]|nr:VTT domain-containing protein [Acidobacteriota bacterium]
MEALLAELSGASVLVKILILGSWTLVSEDLTTILAGIMVSQGYLHPMTAVAGCFLGIFFGDGALYVLGLVVGRPALKLPVLRNLLPEEKVEAGARWFEKRGMIVVFISRFLPGTRLPTYFAAGLVGARMRYFLLASGLAVGVWTPLLVFVSYFFGDQMLAVMEANEKYKWPIMIGGILALFSGVRLALALGNWKSRRKLRSRLYRLRRWEFWPMYVFYAPIVLYNIWQALKHFRLNLPLASNPGILNSGYVGESKSEILRSFKEQDRFIARFHEIRPDKDVHSRVREVEDWMERENLSFPVIIKPDVGQRGAGVKRMNNREELHAYLAAYPLDAHVQAIAPGPYEFGVFYRRFPWEERGRITGLTGKEFPRVVGDGKSTLEELILRHPKAMGRMHIYLNRFRKRLDEVLPMGDSLYLVTTGNHCLGTLFTDSNYLVTPELESRFDQISHAIPGFYIGRYDVRADDLEGFRTGESFKIIELNGSASEPGHMYDNRHNLWYAWRTLFVMYRDIWQIGRANVSNGFRPVTIWKLLQDHRRYARQLHRHLKN